MLLDGRTVKHAGAADADNPVLRPLTAAPRGGMAAQGESSSPSSMPLTRLVNSAIDGVAERMDEVVADVAKYAGSDLVSYRAVEPVGLAAAQAEAWDPLLRLRPGAPSPELARNLGRDVSRPRCRRRRPRSPRPRAPMRGRGLQRRSGSRRCTR